MQEEHEVVYLTQICPATAGWRAVAVEHDGSIFVEDIAAWVASENHEIYAATPDGDYLSIIEPGSPLTLIGPRRFIPWSIRKLAMRVWIGYWTGRLMHWLTRPWKGDSCDE